MTKNSYLPRFQHVADQITVVAAVDTQQDRADHAASLFDKARAETDYRKVLDDIDAVLLAVPHDLHHPIALDCLNAGKHVLLEKPMANTEQQCLELIEAAERENKTLMVGYIMRYHPLTLALKETIDKGLIGTVFQLSLWTEQYTRHPDGHWANRAVTLGGGQLFSHGCHYIDLLMWFLGRPVSGVHIGTNLGTPWMEKEGTSNVTMQFEGGALGYHAGTWGARGTRLGYSFHAHGEKGMLEANFTLDKLILHRDNTDEHVRFHGSQEGKQSENQLSHFAHCIETGSTPDTDGRSSLQSLRVIWRLYDAEQRNVVADLTGLGLDEVEEPLQLRVNEVPIPPSTKADPSGRSFYTRDSSNCNRR